MPTRRGALIGVGSLLPLTGCSSLLENEVDIVFRNNSTSERHAIAVGVQANDIQPLVASANLKPGAKKRVRNVIPHLDYVPHSVEFTVMLNSEVVVTTEREVPLDLDAFTITITTEGTIEVLPPGDTSE